MMCNPLSCASPEGTECKCDCRCDIDTVGLKAEIEQARIFAADFSPAQDALAGKNLLK